MGQRAFNKKYPRKIVFHDEYTIYNYKLQSITNIIVRETCYAEIRTRIAYYFFDVPLGLFA